MGIDRQVSTDGIPCLVMPCRRPAAEAQGRRRATLQGAGQPGRHIEDVITGKIVQYGASSPAAAMVPPAAGQLDHPPVPPALMTVLLRLGVWARKSMVTWRVPLVWEFLCGG